MRYPLFKAWSEDSLEISFKFLRSESSFEDSARFAAMLNELYAIPGIEPTKEEWRDTFLRVQYAALDDVALPTFLQFYDRVIGQLKMPQSV